MTEFGYTMMCEQSPPALVPATSRSISSPGPSVSCCPRYTPGYYAVFVHDPDGIKLEFVHRPEEGDLVLRVAALEARLRKLEGPD
jgi:hypothetical protein